MKLSVNGTELNLSPEYEEYLNLMCTAVVPPDTPPIESLPKMVEKILLDNYSINIQQHPQVRPKSVAEKFKEIELEAGLKVSGLINSSFGS